jgi:hypothetical protein
MQDWLRRLVMSEKLWEKISKWRVTMYDGEEVTVEAATFDILSGRILVFFLDYERSVPVEGYNQDRWASFTRVGT